MAKKLFVVALNYFNTQYELQGCLNDVAAVEEAYQAYGFNDVTRYVETQDHASLTEPKVAETLAALEAWVRSSKAGDLLVFHYSGHGSFTEDLNGDETDGRDEMICLLDGMVLDDDLRRVMVDTLPDSVKLRCWFDCCHSGTILDLPFNWKLSKSQGLFKPMNIFDTEKSERVFRDVVMISGCRDDQTSADAWIEEHKKNEGAMTWAWLKTLDFANKYMKRMTWKDVVEKMRFTLVKGGYDQVPQISMADRALLEKPIEFTQN